MSDAPSSSPGSNDPAPLMRHARREDWGRAILLWERENKRAYQFEDGEMRIFAERFYEMMLPATVPDPALRLQLQERAAASGHLEAGPRQSTRRAKKAPTGPVPTLDDQVKVFEGMFAGGFSGTAWTEAHRAQPDARRRKNYRDPAIAEAIERLAEPTLREMVEQGNPQGVLETLLEVVGNTDLATNKQLEMFGGLTVDKELAESLIGFIHDTRQGDLATMARLRRALARHGRRKLTWPGITAARALAHPQDHMCIRPSVIRAQAKLMLPGFKLGSTPSAEDYARSLEIVMAVRQHLTNAGLPPRDLFDVTDFMAATLAASVKDKLLAAMAERI